MAAAPLNILKIISHDTGEMALYLTQEQLEFFMPRYTHFLATRAVRFSNCHDATPECSAARAALATGQEPHEKGCEVLGLTHPPFNNELADRSHHIARWLKKNDARYRTLHAGVEHVTNDVVLSRAPHSLFDEHIATQDNYVDSVIPPLLARIAALAAEGTPFYAQIDLEETHREFRPALKVAAADLPPLPPGLPDTPEVRDDWTGFLGEMRELDRGYGLIFDALEKMNLFGNTLVIATSDHGIAFPGYKCHLTAGGTQVYLSISGPGFSAGTTCSALVSHTDIFPTICEAAGIPTADWARGEPLQPLLENAASNKAVFAELTHHVAEDTMRAIRTDEWLFIERFGHSTRPPANIDDCAAKTTLLQNPDYLKVPRFQLYHLASDPQEKNNLADLEPAQLDKLRAQLWAHMRETNDPLVNGWPVPRAPGKEVADHREPSAEAWLKKRKGIAVETPEFEMPADSIYPFTPA